MNLNEIQNALTTERVDGWLFFDHHRRDPLAYDILGISPTLLVSRRWYYFIPASGEPRGLVHRVEPHTLDALPGSKSQYSRWSEQTTSLSQLCGDARSVAMQFSPQCAVPYVSMVDAGTVDLIRSFGVNVVTSANLVQLFEARWTEVQLESH
ncbi:MAG: aminopeptidase P family protein, partial [Bryobacteraceae bacterium]|nr:aminopeptidase P family protein [Bryobacteraceae bacterium]